jgi:hypothetical protein
LARQDGQRWRRTAKPCGPDAPTLASSWRKRFRRRRWQTSPVTGESTEETVKTIARGMPGDPGVTVVTNARAFYHTTRGCGRTRRPAFPAPSLERAERAGQASRETSGEIAKACSAVILPATNAKRLRKEVKRRSDLSIVIPGWCLSTRPGISRFRVRCFASPRNDGLNSGCLIFEQRRALYLAPLAGRGRRRSDSEVSG